MPDTATAPEAAAEAPTVDVALLRKHLEWATAEATAGRARPAAHGAGEWRQTVYAIRPAGSECGSAFCIAGRAVLDAGYEFDWSFDGSMFEQAAYVVGGRFIHEVAQELMGLTSRQAYTLFSSSNTLADLWAIAAQLTAGEIVPPPGLEPDQRARAWWASVLNEDAPVLAC